MSPRDGASAISRLKGRRDLDDDTVAEKLIAIRSRYDALLAERRLRDFDDLILHALELLQTHPAVRLIIHDAYPFLFVDELQDTNLLQMDLLTQLVGDGSRVFAVADDDQMIYGWRDAHPENINEFVNRFEVDEIALKGNYRCPKNIVTAANEVIVQNDRRRDVLMESRVEDRDGELVVMSASTVSEGEAVARAVELAMGDGTPLGQIAVLAPHKFKFDDVLEALDRRGVRYVHPGGDQLTARPIVVIVRLALRCVAGGVVAAADVAPIGLDKDPAEVATTIQTRAAQAAEGQPRGLLNRLLGSFDWGTVREPKHEPDAIRVLARMFRKALDDEHPATPPELASALVLHWDRLEASALRAENAVKIMTSFTAKGTEYQVVILPFLNSGIVPYQFKNSEIDWQEARRVFYVALTRAERRVVLIHDAGRATSELLDLVTPHATDRMTV
jgi:superfamily I DNA/RNA helicase